MAVVAQYRSASFIAHSSLVNRAHQIQYIHIQAKYCITSLVQVLFFFRLSKIQANCMWLSEANREEAKQKKDCLLLTQGWSIGFESFNFIMCINLFLFLFAPSLSLSTINKIVILLYYVDGLEAIYLLSTWMVVLILFFFYGVRLSKMPWVSIPMESNSLDARQCDLNGMAWGAWTMKYKTQNILYVYDWRCTIGFFVSCCGYWMTAHVM